MVANNSHSMFNGHVEFSGNSAGYDGGGMVANNSHSVQWKRFILETVLMLMVEVLSRNMNMLSSRATVLVYDGGGMVVVFDSYSTFYEHVEFSGNSAGKDGGGMIVGFDSYSTFNEHVEFSGNSAYVGGGGIAVVFDSYSIFCEHVEFCGNSAGEEGGGMEWRYDSNSTFYESVEFSGNSAGDDGGGMAVGLIHT